METPRKTIILTGATGGIGTALVHALLDQGYEVIGACRHPERLPKLPHLSGITLDLGLASSVQEALGALRGRTIHAIINNAGIMPLRTTTITADGHELTYAVNYLNTVDFTRRLLPQMEDGGAVVFTTSVTRRLPFRASDAAQRAMRAKSPWRRFLNYGRTKWLLVLEAQKMAVELAPRRIRVNAADPGVVDTGIITLGWERIDRLADKIFRPLISPPAKGARAALRALTTTATGKVHTQTATHSG